MNNRSCKTIVNVKIVAIVKHNNCKAAQINIHSKITNANNKVVSALIVNKRSQGIINKASQ